MIVITYGIDKAVYDHPRSIHNIVLTTTMYSFKGKTLVHLQFGKLLQNKMEARLQIGLGEEQFMLEHADGFIESLTYERFEKKRTQFEAQRAAKEIEVLENYCYADKRKQHEIVQVVISIKDGGMRAVIDFESVAQYENFVPPAWLILP